MPTDRSLIVLRVATLMVLLAGANRTVEAQDSLPAWLKDRGDAISSSMFATYIHPGELVVYPFFEYLRDNNREYQPKEFGLGPEIDFRGRFHSTAEQIFLGLGVNDWLALEFEMAHISAELTKSPSDGFLPPGKIRQSGLTDIEGQVRARVTRESVRWPEFFVYSEFVARTQRAKFLISENYWDIKPGVGFIKGFGFGTLSARINLEYNHEEKKLDLGELSVEYLKRVSPNFRLFVDFEGGETGSLDEWTTVQGFELRLSHSLFLKFDNTLGISSKADDWVPQAGLMWAPKW
jgi:hypothetical protein